MPSDFAPIDRYRALLAAGTLKPDAEQARAAQKLDSLARALKSYRTGPLRIFGLSLGSGKPPKGLYLHGDVGRGKSLLMDLFFASLPFEKKRRIHFNAFMTETHARIHEWRGLDQDARARRPEFVREAGDEPIAPVAKRIARDVRVLCFDEFQVTDVADAMILGRLFERLFAHGVVLVLTSNTAPERLYWGGLNRQLFLPFIALIEERLELVELNGPKDYRLDRLNGMKAYLTPLGEEADAAMDDAWQRLAKAAQGAPAIIPVLEREFVVPRAANGVARFTFDELCGANLGAADYLALARRFHTVLIDHIPRLGPEKRNEARRFTVLIDTLYDEHVAVVCSAAVPPGEICVEGDSAESFRRTASRLVEMQSAEYLAREREAAIPAG